MNDHEDADGTEIFQASGREGAAPHLEDGSAPHSVPQADASIRSPRAKRAVGFGLAAVVLLGIGAGGGALAVERLQSSDRPAAMGTTNGFGPGSSGASGSSGSVGSSPGDPFGGFGRQGSIGGFGGSTPDGTATSGATATAAQQTGVVTIVSALGYESGEAAGTGIVLTSSGEILTNNHVVEGSTSIQVTVESTGRTYTATVVGTDATDDVAVLQLKHASGLPTAKIASTAAAVGDAVTAVGNAGGTGTLSAASGTVTDLRQSITTQAEGSSASESLSGMIETNADVVSGDSGGPLEDASGRVVGIDTAASSGTADVAGYAIPISSALRIADAITSGSASSSITLGYPAFLGVEVAPGASTDGAGVARALNGTPAASAGLAGGDVITAVDGKRVGSASALTAVLHSYSPGDTVTVDYTDTSGSPHSVTVVLASGPAA